jgi:hypothetical protein
LTRLGWLAQRKQKTKIKNMNKTQKTVIVAAAIAGLVGGVIANASVKTSNDQNQNIAGKQGAISDKAKIDCNGCGGGTNNVSAN